MNLPGLAVRNIYRNPVRLALTIAGVAVALLTFVTLRTAVMSWVLLNMHPSPSKKPLRK